MKELTNPDEPDRPPAPGNGSDSTPARPPGDVFDATVEPVIPETPVEAELVTGPGESAGETPTPATSPSLDDEHARQRRVRLPLLLFLAACVSTFWVGAASWEPTGYWPFTYNDFRQAIIRDWQQGLLYMVCVVSILLAHEMGHFLTTLRYRIPASLPFFLPFPFMPLGTLGAVIGMDGKKADRRQLFDIGIAGPLAGLALAVPVLCVGVATFDFNASPGGVYVLDTPIFLRWLFDTLRPEEYLPGQQLTTGQLNPFLMAGWVGLLVTGLNMMPISQLDGGHVLYTLFGRRAHALARMLVFLLIIYIVFWEASIWALMLVLVIFIGIDHPPTANDDVPLGWFRRLLGCLALSIPYLCIPPRGIWVPGL
jgi:membrane-associated protease RseP (regulator of RpoE activity)